MARLFISQKRIDAWTVENRVQIDGEIMTLTDLGRSFRIVPAFRFTGVAGGEADARELVGKVKDEEEVEALGGDAYMDSVIIDDIPYEVQSGFLGDPE